MKQFNLAEYLKNPERKIVTRGGYPATIVSTTFHQENYPVVAEVCFSNYDKKQSYSFTANGLFLDSSEDSRDLFFAPEKHEGWVNIYKAGTHRETLVCMANRYVGSCIWPTEESAKTAADADPVTTIKIEWEE